MESTKIYTKKEKEIAKLEFALIQDFTNLRRNANISQQQLADETHIIRTTIARIENNMNSPQVKTLLTLLESLGYT